GAAAAVGLGGAALALLATGAVVLAVAFGAADAGAADALGRTAFLRAAGRGAGRRVVGETGADGGVLGGDVVRIEFEGLDGGHLGGAPVALRVEGAVELEQLGDEAALRRFRALIRNRMLGAGGMASGHRLEDLLQNDRVGRRHHRRRRIANLG